MRCNETYQNNNHLIFIHLYTKKDVLRRLFLEFGGEQEIRTLDTLPYTHFPGVLLKPLGQLTVVLTLSANEALI